jgi:hypothetical protein
MTRKQAADLVFQAKESGFKLGRMAALIENYSNGFDIETMNSRGWEIDGDPSFRKGTRYRTRRPDTEAEPGDLVVVHTKGGKVKTLLFQRSSDTRVTGTDPETGGHKTLVLKTRDSMEVYKKIKQPKPDTK